jgi:succinoglycan biosynthesis transport protein ExoP
VSNLIPRNGPNPDLAVQGVQTIQVRDLGPGKGSPEAEAGDGIKPRELWRAIKRRKKLVGLTAGVIFVLTGLNTAHERLFRPVYQGSFTLLITDPISNEGRGGASTAASGQMFQQLALNTTSNDIPTLIALLQSPLLLEPVAKRFNLSSGALGQSDPDQHRWLQPKGSLWRS